MKKREIPNEERQRCEVWTRVMGYFRPVSEFNNGKQSEHAERAHFEQGSIIEERRPIQINISDPAQS